MLEIESQKIPKNQLVIGCDITIRLNRFQRLLKFLKLKHYPENVVTFFRVGEHGYEYIGKSVKDTREFQHITELLSKHFKKK